MKEGPAHDDGGEVVPSTDFDYKAIDERVFNFFEPDSELMNCTQAEIDRTMKLLEVILKWVWQSGMKNPQGLQIRSMIACWVFLKELRPMKLSDLARGFGKEKQSLGRWHDHFKKIFPFIKTPHMR